MHSAESGRDRRAARRSPRSPDLRPIVVHVIGSTTEAIYGLVLALSAMALTWYYGRPDAGRVALSVISTAFVFWLAHAYAYVVGSGISQGHRSIRADLVHALRENLSLIEVVVPLELLLIPGEIGLVSNSSAIAAATLAASVEIAAAGGYAATQQGRRLWGVIVSAVAGLGFGLLVVLLKVLAFTH